MCSDGSAVQLRHKEDVSQLIARREYGSNFSRLRHFNTAIQFFYGIKLVINRASVALHSDTVEYFGQLLLTAPYCTMLKRLQRVGLYRGVDIDIQSYSLHLVCVGRCHGG